MQEVCYKGTQDEVLEEAKRMATEQYEVIESTDRILESMWVLKNIFPNILGELRKWSYNLEEPCGHCPIVFSSPRPQTQEPTSTPPSSPPLGLIFDRLIWNMRETL